MNKTSTHSYVNDAIYQRLQSRYRYAFDRYSLRDEFSLWFASNSVKIVGKSERSDSVSSSSWPRFRDAAQISATRVGSTSTSPTTCRRVSIARPRFRSVFVRFCLLACSFVCVARLTENSLAIFKVILGVPYNPVNTNSAAFDWSCRAFNTFC